MKWLYFGGHGTLDLVAETYTCLIKKRGGPLLFYANGSKTADLIFRPDAGFSAETGEFVPEAGMKNVCGSGEFELAYNSGDVRVVVKFFEDRVEVKADYEGGEVLPDTFYIGRGSLIYTDRVFTPSQPDFNLPIAHYLRPEEAVDLSPGLMTPAPWCFSARQEDGKWIGFSLEPDADELDFAGFGSAPGVGREMAFRVIYGGCRPACGKLSVPPLVMRFGLSDEFEVFARHTGHLLERGKIEKPERYFDWHRGVSVCGWRWQQGTKPTEELYERNVAMFDEKGIDFDILIIDDFWGDSDEHGVWKACERWKNLRGFIDRRHAEGRKVLLWVCTHADGLPDDEKVGRLHDIDSDAWKERLKADAHRMLSPDEGCYDADGIKFDFTALYPRTPDCSRYGVGYILERYRLVAEAMRAVKPDAMLLNQSINPYFVKYQSALRLNDFTALPCHGLEEMRIRGKIAKAVGMGLPVDSDHVACSLVEYDGGLDFFREMESVGDISIYANERDLELPGLAETLRDLSKRHCLRK